MRKKLVGILCTVVLAAGMTGCSMQNSAVATEEKKQTASETKTESEIKENIKKEENPPIILFFLSPYIYKKGVFVLLFQTQRRLTQNASTFDLKHKCVSTKTQVHLRQNASTFYIKRPCVF